MIKLERQADAGATVWQTWTYTYDNRNHLLSVTDPLDRVTSYAYDGEENLTTVTDDNGAVDPLLQEASTVNLMQSARVSNLALAAAAVAPAAPAYNVDAIADTRSPILGTVPVGGVGLPSINDNGKVAFTAQYTTGGRPFIVLKDLSTNQVLRNFQYGAPFTASNFIQVNNADQIAFRVVSDDGLVSYLNRLDGLSSGPGIATGSLTPALIGKALD